RKVHEREEEEGDWSDPEHQGREEDVLEEPRHRVREPRRLDQSLPRRAAAQRQASGPRVGRGGPPRRRADAIPVANRRLRRCRLGERRFGLRASVLEATMRTLLCIAPLTGAGLGARPAGAEELVPAAVVVPAAPVGAGTVNINTATVDELDRLPGVGPTKAEAIAAFRAKHGAFKRVDDLDRVKGFGRKL